jgi:hypothetical protein
MKIESETTTQHEILPVTPDLECPLHLAMEEIAHLAVQQHVLYLEGECQPRPELLQRLDAWSSLHNLIRSRICVASREESLSPEALEIALDALLTKLADSAMQPQLRNIRATLTTCARATSCPLGMKSRE